MDYKKPKSSGCSTGRGTRVKKSTAMDWDEWVQKKRKYPVKYSTGEDPHLKHFTGVEFEKKAMQRRQECGDDKPGGAKHPGFTYKHYRKKDKPQSENNKKSFSKSFKKVVIDY